MSRVRNGTARVHLGGLATSALRCSPSQTTEQNTVPVERVSNVSRDPSLAMRKLVRVPCSSPHSSADHMYRPVRILTLVSVLPGCERA